MKALMIGVALVVASASGCSTWDKLSREEKGAVIGAGAGGVAGNAIGGGVLGTAAGAAVGGVVGHEVGRRTDDKR